MPDGYAKRGLRDILNELIERTNSIIMRLRIVEQRNNTSMVKMDSLQTDALEQIKESKTFIKNFENRMKKYEETMIQMETMIKNISKKINRSVTKNEIKGLEQSIKLYNPVTSQFVTKRELNQALKDIGGSK
ncbi:MAG: hypothetical protein KKB03_03415 [Nanoarchaeota archaeon]|nr:hypothetical protein [Nanoarchaeota archaeon]MBU1134919.1 hypothetical protein [Nanoarchaeota archaeon]MBU2520262.1 hypothetical protein [Nanoarchaeota archaeon]